MDRKIAEFLESQPGGAAAFQDDTEDEEDEGDSRVSRVRAGAGDVGRGGGADANGDGSDDDDSDDGTDEEAEERKRQFFSELPDADDGTKGTTTFAQMDLSRPLLRATTALGFEAPSLVQQRAIPIALAGRDLCVCAQTGSGKTAAFMLPVLERLMFRPKKVAQTRVLVLSPTRELAVQVFQAPALRFLTLLSWSVYVFCAWSCFVLSVELVARITCARRV